MTLNEEKGILTGPGVIDDKGGIIVALKGVTDFIKQHRIGYNIQFISSPNEEMGSIGFIDLLTAFGRSSDIVLGFEPAHDNGDIISSRAGNRWYKVEINGTEAHAGRANGEEVNAAHELVGKISKLLHIKEKLPNVKINVGNIKGGKDKYNIICGHAEAKIDTRFKTHQESHDLHREILDVLNTPIIVSKQDKTAEVKYWIEDDCPAFEEFHNGLNLKLKYQEIVESLEGHKIGESIGCGASDINYLANAFNIAIDGLGPVGGNMHTNNEFLKIKSLTNRANALTNFLIYLNESHFPGGFNGSN